MTLFQTTKDAELLEQSEGWPKARPTIDFTSDPFWLSTWDRESRKFGEVVKFGATTVTHWKASFGRIITIEYHLKTL